MRCTGIFLSLMMITLCESCAPSISGNSSETTNSIVIVANPGTVSGIAPPFSSVFCLINNFDPLIGSPYDSISTDSTGEFMFTVQNGLYNIICSSNNLRSITGILVNSQQFTIDTIYDTLYPGGSLQGYSPYTQTGFKTFLFLEGTPYFTVADSSGFFKLDSIPQGHYTMKRWAYNYNGPSVITNSVDTISQVITSGITIMSDSVVTVDW